jgi:hypothetical protein
VRIEPWPGFAQSGAEQVDKRTSEVKIVFSTNSKRGKIAMLEGYELYGIVDDYREPGLDDVSFLEKIN